MIGNLYQKKHGKGKLKNQGLLTFASAMGGTQSQPVDLPALPQQRIVNVRDGQVISVAGG